MRWSCRPVYSANSLPSLSSVPRVALDALVQVHTKAELDHALAVGTEFICVTNRDIHSFVLTPGTCEALLPLIPAGKVLAVAEGGFGTAENLEHMGKAGAKAVLMGTALMKDRDPAGVLEQGSALKHRKSQNKRRQRVPPSPCQS